MQASHGAEPDCPVRTGGAAGEGVVVDSVQRFHLKILTESATLIITYGKAIKHFRLILTDFLCRTEAIFMNIRIITDTLNWSTPHG